jgi:hypothetical protein
MSREGPVNFGKPLMYLTIVGCIAGGIYLWKTWPATYEGPGWKVDFPNGWETAPHNDPTQPGMVVSHGPLAEEGMEGVGWVKLLIHGTLSWPQLALDLIPGTPDKMDPDGEIAHRKSMIFEYEDDKNMRYTGVCTQRGDALVMVAVGAPKHLFETNRGRLEKCAQSLRVWR